MIRITCCVLFGFAVLACALNVEVAAQTNSCFTYFDYQFPEPVIPGSGSNCTWAGPYLLSCWVPNYTCPPPADSCPTCGGGSNNGGRPVSFATGNTFITETDVRIPGLSNGLTLVRTWNSKWPATQSASKVGLFGPNWRSNFEERVFLGSDNFMKYSRGDGNFWSFGFWYWGPNGTFVWKAAAPANIAATLTNGNTWTITFPNGEQKLFDNTTGSLTAIIDRNGNTTQLSYDSANRLVTVTDAASRHLYFSYPNNLTFLISGVTSDVGISLSYAYDSQGRLITVTNPDQSTLSFEYDSNSFITAVKDSSGKIFESHTYDSGGRGLTSSQAGGVDALTVSYPH